MSYGNRVMETKLWKQSYCLPNKLFAMGPTIFPYKTKYYPCFIGQYLLRFCPKNNTNKTTYYIDLIYCDLWYIKRAGF